jgi:hypothetical protein
LLEGEMAKLFRLPLTSAIPAFFLYYSALPAETVSFKKDFIEYSYSPVTMKLIKDSVYEELPSIDSKFEDSDKSNQAIKVIIDENAFNWYVRILSKNDKFFALRDFLAADLRYIQYT